MTGPILGMVIGLAFIVAGTRELIGRSLLQRRMRRAAGVFVAREDVRHVAGPAVRSRAGRFRFTTEDGRVVERTSALSTFPGPKPGRPLTVLYDPASPEATAERAWVHLSLLFAVSPSIIAVGVYVVVVSSLAL